MKITKNEVEHVAHLARLTVTGEELEEITRQLDTILSYVEKLERLDTDGIKPTTHVFSVSNVFREDVTTKSLSQEESLANAPLHNGESFQVPRII